MGMFDIVRVSGIECWNCGEELEDFQTKDTDCTMTPVEFWQCDSFYTSCHNCVAWNEFRYPDHLKQTRKLEDYELVKEPW